jgi:hypothetical protein
MGGDQRPETFPFRTIHLTGNVLDCDPPPPHHGSRVGAKVGGPIRVGGSPSVRADDDETVPIGPGIEDDFMGVSGLAARRSQFDLQAGQANRGDRT